MNYKPELGIFGNIKRLYSERNKTNNKVDNNKFETDISIKEKTDGLVEVADVVSDEAEALDEIAGMIAELYEAITELADMMAEGE